MTRTQTIPITSSMFEDESSYHELSNICIVKSLNFKTVDILRCQFSEASANSSNWQELAKKLLSQGFYLQRIGNFLWLKDCHSYADICPCQFLGFSLSMLEHRLNQNSYKAAEKSAFMAQ